MALLHHQEADMTGIETIRIEGWGGGAELRGLTVEADYQPGVFELAQLAAAVFALCTAAGALVLGLGMAAVGLGALAWVAYGGAIVSLITAIAMWCEAFDGLRCRGSRSVDLARGWVAVGAELRPLRDATVDVEIARIGVIEPFSRLSLVFPDGAEVRLAQGPHARIRDFVHALRHAPCVAHVPVRLAA
ncbi:MAG: hypothetical protein R3F61_21325 [Myxococcota bacterium]